MTEREFTQQLDDLMMAIEDAIEDSGADIDYETAAGILTLTCENNTPVILSRQIATMQLWVAARSGGYHCDFQNDEWMCGNENLVQLLNRCLSEQSGEEVLLKLA